MISLDNISIGRYSLGAVSLGSIGGSAKGSSTPLPLVKQILAKLKKEQPQLAEALVCLYSPNLQGMTNKQLFDSMLVGEYPILKDLSGNGYDIELHGFDGTSASGVDGDGNLHFDGVNDYGKTANVINFSGYDDITLLMYTEIYEYESPNRYVQAAIEGEGFSNFTYTDVNGTVVYVGYKGNTKNFNRYFIEGTHIVILNKGGIFIDNAKIIDKQNYSQRFRDSHMVIGADWNRERPANMTIKSTILFNRSLTDSEIDWVKTNMLVSQEPKKYTINFYHYADGEPILLGTKKVNNGAEIGELPVIEEIGEWYYDLSLDEESLVYEDDYVESDLNLYGN